jgi:hypothetical protein
LIPALWDGDVEVRDPMGLLREVEVRNRMKGEEGWNEVLRRGDVGARRNQFQVTFSLRVLTLQPPSSTVYHQSKMSSTTTKQTEKSTRDEEKKDGEIKQDEKPVEVAPTVEAGKLMPLSRLLHLSAEYILSV